MAEFKDFIVEHINTGCLYEKEGQKITIAYGVGVTHFFDHSRMLDGTIRKGGLSTMDVVRAYVLGEHDILDMDWELRKKFMDFYKTVKTDEWEDYSRPYKDRVIWGWR